MRNLLNHPTNKKPPIPLREVNIDMMGVIVEQIMMLKVS